MDDVTEPKQSDTKENVWRALDSIEKAAMYKDLCQRYHLVLDQTPAGHFLLGMVDWQRTEESYKTVVMHLRWVHTYGVVPDEVVRERRLKDQGLMIRPGYAGATEGTETKKDGGSE